MNKISYEDLLKICDFANVRCLLPKRAIEILDKIDDLYQERSNLLKNKKARTEVEYEIQQQLNNLYKIMEPFLDGSIKIQEILDYCNKIGVWR